jgi:hypothetical protein
MTSCIFVLVRFVRFAHANECVPGHIYFYQVCVLLNSLSRMQGVFMDENALAYLQQGFLKEST